MKLAAVLACILTAIAVAAVWSRRCEPEPFDEPGGGFG